MENKAKIITVAGKGGVGKTSICASIVRLLVEKYPDKKILAIDADPAVGLSVALGVDVKLTLDDIRMSIVDSVENGETREALELLSEARFRIFDALVEMPGFVFLAIGRPEYSTRSMLKTDRKPASSSTRNTTASLWRGWRRAAACSIASRTPGHSRSTPRSAVRSTSRRWTSPPRQ